MDMIRRIVGVVLIVIGAVVAVHMIAQPLYDASSEASPHNPIWSIINPFMALAVVLGVGVIFGYIRKRGVDQEGGMGRRLPASFCRPTRCSTASCHTARQAPLWASCSFGTGSVR